jgi:C4-type Zn-finger protein
MADDASNPPGGYATDEIECPVCGRERQHHVRIEVITESENYGGNQPYRITECQICGNERKERIGMGD